MIAKYYDPLFYISSDKMPFTIRLEVILKDEIDGNILKNAVDTAIKRFPYFSLRVKICGEEYIAEENKLPIVVYEEKEIFPLGGKEVNYHLLSLSYKDRQINFYVSHVITDGCGIYPFIKSVLYYYISEKYQRKLDETGVYLVDTPFFPDELDNPYPEELMEKAEPFYIKKPYDCFKLKDGGLTGKEEGRVFRFSISEKEIMDFSFDHDGSPNALISALMAKAIWKVNKDQEKSLVSEVSFNLRGGLGNKHSYKMLCSSLALEYPKKMQNYEILKLCTCSRGMMTILSQAENVIYYAKQRKERFLALENIKTLKERKRIIGERALKDSTDNTFSVSYVGRIPFGDMAEYIEDVFHITDGSTYNTAFIEVASINGRFDISFLQGFSSDVYYKAFLDELNNIGIKCEFKGESSLNSPKIILP